VDTTQQLPTVISFCSGYGGIERGLDLAGVEHRVLAYVEIEAFAIANLVAKMESGALVPAPIFTDLKTFPAHLFRGCVDIITGGYPCQPFSAAGKRLGTEDPRHLWPYILDHIKAIRPVRCLFENVEGHISLGLREVIGDLEGAGYNATWGIFSAAEVGAPHQRKRVYIMANSISAGVWDNDRAPANEGRSAAQFGRADVRQGDREERSVRPESAGSSSAAVLGSDTNCRDGSAQQERQHKRAKELDGCGDWGLATPDSSDVANAGGRRFSETNEWQDQQQRGAKTVGAGKNVADTRDPRPSRAGIEPQPGIKIIEPCDSDSTGECGPDVADTISQRLEGLTRHGSDSSEPGRQSPQSQRPVSQSGVFSDTTIWLPEPAVGRVVDGCPDRVDRLRLLGNGVVPQTAARAWETLTKRLT
jgi:DNA (cytosine-5)-methyltransferase 1